MAAKTEFVVGPSPKGLEHLSITIGGDRALHTAALLDLGGLAIEHPFRRHPNKNRRDSEIIPDAMKLLRKTNGRKKV